MNSLVLSRLLLSAAFLLSAWLGWQSLQNGPALMDGCGLGSSCDSVLQSAWAWVGPVPTAWIGAAFYLMQIILLCPHSSGRRGLIYLLSGNIAAALFFIGVQALLLGAWCPWCCSIHLLATAGAVCGFVAVWRRSEHPSASIRAVAVTPSVAWSTLAHLLFLGLFSSLMLTAKSEEKTGKSTAKAPPPAKTLPLTTSEADGKRWLSLHGERFRFELETLPRLGSLGAKHLIVCITDPTCHHCRNTSELLSEARESQKEGEVAIVFLPGTRDPELSPALQTALLTLWRENPKAWADLSARLHRSDLAPTPEAVTEAARLALGGKTQWNAALEKHRTWAGQLIQQTRELMAENARVAGREVTLPQLQFQNQILLGAPSGVQDLQSLTGATFPWSMDLGFEDPADLSSNPCKNRQFCQRLVIILTGAGRDDVVPGALKLDRFGHSALDDAKILSQSGPNQNPPLVYVFSGYEELTKAVSALKSDRIKMFASSHDDWSRFLERLPLELEPLLKNTKCAAMIKSRLQDSMSAAEKLAVLSEFISVEVSVYGHSVLLESESKEPDQTHGLHFAPSTKEEADNLGSQVRGIASHAFDHLDFQRLKTILPLAVFRGLTTACNGTEVVKFLEPSNGSECACFVSASSATTTAMSWPDKSPFGLHFVNAKSKGEPVGILSTLPLVKDALYDPYVASPSSKNPGAYLPSGIRSSSSKNRSHGDMSYGDSSFALYDTNDYLSLPVNPLSGLVKSSADSIADAALQTLARGGDPDADLAQDLSVASSLSEVQAALTKAKDPRDIDFPKQALHKATVKADRVISPLSRVTAEIAKGNTDYGAYRLKQLFAPDSKFEGVNAEDKAFAKTLKDARAHYAGTQYANQVGGQFKRFNELFDATSENFIGNVTRYGSQTDSKLVIYWSRLDGMKALLNTYYRNQLRSGKMEPEEYRKLIKSLEGGHDRYERYY